MIRLNHIITIIIEDRDDNSSGGDNRIEWNEQFHHLELHLEWKKRSGNHFVML
jgi:hypothetical protein